jgi:hypothetical protein
MKDFIMSVYTVDKMTGQQVAVKVRENYSNQHGGKI